MSIQANILVAHWRIKNNIVRRATLPLTFALVIVMRILMFLAIPFLSIGLAALIALKEFCINFVQGVLTFEEEFKMWAAMPRSWKKVWSTNFDERPIARVIQEYSIEQPTPADD